MGNWRYVRVGRALPVQSVALLGLGLLLAVCAGELAVRLAAWLSPEVRYLATNGSRRRLMVFQNLHEYLATQPTHVVPHRNFMNYRANALGFYDEEFLAPRPPGRFRIMALGDSFTYGSVPYPESVMTLLEEHLRAVCQVQDLDLLNFGIAATGVWDYKTVFELGQATYDPDVVLVNIYLGNDGPDSYRHTNDFPKPDRGWRQVFLWSYLKNLIRLWRGLAPAWRRTVLTPTGEGAASSSITVRGGAIVDPYHTLAANDPSLTGPSFTERAFHGISVMELRRLYVPQDARSLERDWHPILAALDELATQVHATARRLVLTLYPSQVQVYPELRQQVLAHLKKPESANLQAGRIDPDLPNRILLAYCTRRGLACFDLTAALVQASQASPEPLYKLRDTHWTRRGNQVAALAQARQLAPLVCPWAHAGGAARNGR